MPYATPLIFAIAAALLLTSAESAARDKLIPSRTGATASIKVKSQDLNAVANALTAVFEDDGYHVTFEHVEQINFARRASRAQELAYGSVLSPGSTEVVRTYFYRINDRAMRIDCHVSIRQGETAALTDANILPLFGRQYKRMLRRVKRALR